MRILALLQKISNSISDGNSSTTVSGWCKSTNRSTSRFDVVRKGLLKPTPRKTIQCWLCRPLIGPSGQYTVTVSTAVQAQCPADRLRCTRWSTETTEEDNLDLARAKIALVGLGGPSSTPWCLSERTSFGTTSASASITSQLPSQASEGDQIEASRSPTFSKSSVSCTLISLSSLARCSLERSLLLMQVPSEAPWYSDQLRYSIRPERNRSRLG